MTSAVAGRQVRALVISDRSAPLTHLIDALLVDGDIVVLDALTFPVDASEVVMTARPDVVILDLLRHDDQRQLAIERIMARVPTPILTLSAAGHDNGPAAARALVAGALADLPRPDSWSTEDGAELRQRVRQISTVYVIRHPRGNAPTAPKRDGPPVPARRPVVAVGASTGGPSALAIVLSGLEGLHAPVLVVQHLHPDFTGGLVKWMARAAALPVEMATHGQPACAGHIYVAPGGFHLHFGAAGRLELDESPATVHRPSADELFNSVAEHAGASGIGVLLTGMGEDGAKGLLAIHQRGGHTLAQDEASSAVFGMPRAAERLGAVTHLMPLDDLAAAIQRSVQEVLA